MKKSNLILFVAMMYTHLMLAFDIDWDNDLGSGAEPPPDNVPVDNIYFIILAVAMICFYLVVRSRKKATEC